MRNLLTINKEDNAFTAFAKGGVKGMMLSAVGVSVAAIIGTTIKRKEKNVLTFDEVIRASGLKPEES